MLHQGGEITCSPHYNMGLLLTPFEEVSRTSATKNGKVIDLILEENCVCIVEACLSTWLSFDWACIEAKR